jgi:hypothetical protein
VWWKRTLNLSGFGLFRGAIAPPLQSLTGLDEAGIEVTPQTAAADEIWAADLRHPLWGNARLCARRGAEPLPADLVRFASGLTEAERERIGRDARPVLVLDVPSQAGDVLKDRKQFLRFMAAALGRDGIAGFDRLSQIFWSPDRLVDELQHDAALDIIHVHVLHVVTQPRGVWLHSHGLAEMGFVDFDVLRPAATLTSNEFDVIRAIAFLIAEGATSGLVEPVVGGDPIELVAASAFMQSAADQDRALRDAEWHSERRVVCCDPPSTGMLGRLLGSKTPRPSSLLSRGLVEGRHLIRFSDLASDLSAERARDSLPLFDRFRREFEDLHCPALAKLAYEPDSGREGREHLWFEVHGLSADRIDATLVNQPFDIAAMKEGDRGEHAVERMTDWTIVTPIGPLTPRTLEVARGLREVRPEILKALRSAGPA